MMLRFDPGTHTYHRRLAVGEREYPSVSRILQDMGLYVPPKQAKEYHKERGTAIHYGCFLVDRGEWDRASTDKRVRGRIAAYQKFVNDFGFKAEITEEPVWSDAYSLAGTPDHVGLITRPGVPGYGKRAVVDTKSGDPAPAVDIQMALYGFMVEECRGLKVDEHWALWLRDDETYRREPSVNPCALSLGLSAATLWHFRSNHGLL